MNTHTFISLALCFGVISATSMARKSKPYPTPDQNNYVNIASFKDMQAYFHYYPDRDIIISAHRGGMQEGYPENCIASCEQTIKQMPTFIELDFSFTKDSVMVLMHDMTIDRTTNGKGRVADYTYAELQKFNLVDRKGDVTPHKIPTLLEVLEWGKGKVAFNFDNKYMNTKGISQEDKDRAMKYFIRQFSPGGDWAKYHNMFVCPRSMKEMMMYWDAGVHDLMFCMEVSSQEQFDAIDACPVPWDHIIASSRTAMDPMLKPLYKKLHDKGVMIIVSVTQSDDKISNDRNRRTAYLRTLTDLPDLIETDYPAQWIGLPTDRKTLKALKR
ncbi:MAG: glycerophosphodiester phosphodiesterase family protein [Bacteroidaceae bacterium]|nr:glycerophosphodiester phosphodiesterase family protein [Bacteroidaceae bacterium]